MFMRVSRCFFCILVVYAIITKGETALVCSSHMPSSNVKNCSCIVEGRHFPTVLNLCNLNNDYCHVISTTKHTAPGNPSTVYRYYIVNLFRKIQSYSLQMKNDNIIQNNICKQIPRLSGLHTANCPGNSMSCLVSMTTFECSNDQPNSVCLQPRWNADSYGFFENWSIQQQVDLQEGEAGLRTATAVIQITGGPCYFCRPIHDDNIAIDLVTLIGLICDERIITDEGYLYIDSFPSLATPKLIFLLKTSHACYEFQPKQKCPEEENVCKAGNTFNCDSRPANYHFGFPASANHSISTYIRSSNVEYIFGFCAHDVDCSTDQDPVKDVLICKKTYDKDRVVNATAIAYYKDIDKRVILRPTGFVWRLINRDRSLKAVVSFQCDMDKPIASDNFEMTVPSHKPPVLLTLKHRCFCPNPPSQCTAGGPAPTKQPIIATTTSKPPHLTLEILLPIVAVIIIAAVCFVVLRFYHHGPHGPAHGPVPSSSTTTSNSDDPPVQDASNQTTPTGSWHSARSIFSVLSGSFASALSRRPSTPTKTSKRNG